jgi:uncharacterized membrane protein YgcG
MKKFKLVLLAGMIAVSFSAVAAFSNGMKLDQVKAEVSKRVAAKESLDSIFTDAVATRTPVIFLTESLVTPGQDGSALLKALVKAGYPVASARDALIASGVDPASVTDATAAGAQDTGGGGLSAGSSGFTNGGGSTFSGGGGSGGSRS